MSSSRYDRLLISWMYRAGLASKSICQVHESVTSHHADDGYVRNILSGFASAGLRRDGTTYAEACAGYLREKYPDQVPPPLVFPANIAYEGQRIKDETVPSRLAPVNVALRNLEVFTDGDRPEKALRKLNRVEAEHLLLANEGIARAELVKAEARACLDLIAQLREKHQKNPELLDRVVLGMAKELAMDLYKLLHQASDLDRRYVDMRRSAYGLDDPEAAVDTGVKIERVEIHIHQTRADVHEEPVETPWEDAEYQEASPDE